MPRRDPKTGRFMKSADTAKPTDAGSDTGEDPGADSATARDAVRIHTHRRRVGGRIIRSIRKPRL